MKKTRLYLAVLLVLAMLGAAHAAPGADVPAGLAQADEIVAEMVHFPAKDGTELRAYLARPKKESRRPALLLFHEWYGLNDWMMLNARRFAAQGYTTLAVDLYRGQTAADRDEAHELSRALPEERALSDARTSLEYLKGLPSVNPDRIGTVGWCQGGGYSLKFASENPVQACVMCYGRVFTEEAQARELKAPLLGIFGGEDRGIPVADVKRFEALLKTAGARAAIVVYPGAGHAFMNPSNDKGYRPVQANQAWGRIDAFLKENLGGR